MTTFRDILESISKAEQLKRELKYVENLLYTINKQLKEESEIQNNAVNIRELDEALNISRYGKAGISYEGDFFVPESIYIDGNNYYFLVKAEKD